MERRDFIKFCALAATPHAARSSASLQPHFYARAVLMDEHGQTLRHAALVPKRNYTFHYPYAGTPCFLIDLGKPTAQDVTLKTEAGERYDWAGGVGPHHSIVAYSAICSHRMAYPTRQISFISYREQSTAPAAARADMIHCCSERLLVTGTGCGQELRLAELGTWFTRQRVSGVGPPRTSSPA